MEKDKSKLSAARKKLQEYKLSKGGSIPPGVGTTVQSVNETAPPSAATTNGGQQHSSYVQPEFYYPPPPLSSNFNSSSNSSSHQHQQETSAGAAVGIDNHNNQEEQHQNQQIYTTGYPAAPVIPPIQSGSVDFNYSAAGLFNTSSSTSSSSDHHHYHHQDGGSSSSELSVMERNGNINHNQTEESSPAVSSTTSSYFIPSPGAESSSPPTDSTTPRVPPPLASELFQANHNQTHQGRRFTDAGQDFPVNFFQPIPVAQQYQPVSFNGNLFQPPNSNASSQDFIYNNPQTPLFFNVSGNDASNASMNPPPLSPSPYQQSQQQEAPSSHPSEIYKNSNPDSLPTDTEKKAEEIPLKGSNDETNVQQASGENNEDVETGHNDIEQKSVQNETVTETKELHPPVEISNAGPGLNGEASSSSTQNAIRSSPNFREPTLIRTPTPLSRKLSETSQDEKDRQEMQLLQRMQSVQDALELQLEELRLDNKRLTERKTEMTSQLESCERTIQDLRRERDHAREEAKKMLQPLHAKINALYEENQKILQNSSNVGMELRVKLQETTKQYENMEQAVIVVTNQKLELASALDQEKERCKELETLVAKQEEEIAILRNSNSKLEERLKVDQQKDAILHQMEDQRRHFQVQTETLQQELAILKEKLRKAAGSPSNESSLSPSTGLAETVTNQHEHDGHGHSCDSHGPDHVHHRITDTADHSHHHEHPQTTVKSDSSDNHQHCHDHNDHEHGHNHSHDHHGHDHNQSHDDHGHDHSHSHDGHDHSHDGHDHSHGHDHHDHSHEHDHSHDDHSHLHTKHTLSPEQSKNPVEEMKRRLHHLEWENSTFRSDVEKLAAEAKDKKQYEAKCNKLQEECDRLREECQRLELLVIQLQGENDTIGDYIALYQSQRLALKESAKEKDVQLENLAREREMLVAKMGELTQLLRELKGSSAQQAAEGESNQPGHICLGHHDHSPTSEAGAEPSKEIEGKIMNLLTEISSSSLIENFHPCAVCSGRLMNV